MRTATATKTPQVNDLIGWIRKNNRAARTARFLLQIFDVVCQTVNDVNFHVWGSDDNSNRSSKSFILCLYVKTIRAKQARVHFAYFVRRDQHGVIAKPLT